MHAPSPARRLITPERRDSQGHPLSRLLDGIVLAQRYEVYFLEAGGMGAIYRAYDTTEQREVIIKEAYSRESNEHIQLIVALTQEREALIRLDHPGIVRPLDFFVDTGACYLVLEHVPGRTLKKHLAESPCMDVGDAVHIALQLCDVLEHLHSHGLVYRDLKPSNIMTFRGSDRTRQVKLIDFGTARLFKPGQSKDTAALGTVGFAPPEQFGTGQTDARADIYSLGATLHYMLSKRPPDETPFSFPALRSLNPRVSSELETLVARTVRTQPEERYADVASLRVALLEALGKRCGSCAVLSRARSRFCSGCGKPLSQLVPSLLGADEVTPPSPLQQVSSLRGASLLSASPKPAPQAAATPSSPPHLEPVPTPSTAPSIPPSQAPRPLVGTPQPHGHAAQQASSPVSLRTIATTATGGTPTLHKTFPPPPLNGPAEWLLPSPALRGRVLEVDPGKTGAYSRISEALQAARPGDRIEIAAGTFRENLRIATSVHLRGAGPENTRVISQHERPVLEIVQVDQVWVEGLTLEYAGSKPNATVSARKASLVLQKVRIQGATRSGLELGSATRGEVRCCEITSNHQTGILMHSGAEVAVLACHVHNNGQQSHNAGIEVRDHGAPRVEGNLLRDNGVGVYIHERARPAVRNNTLHRNGRDTDCAALEVKDQAEPLLEGNLLLENSGGLIVKGRAAPRIVGNRLENNGSGSRGYAIEVLGQAAPLFEDNLITGNALGVLVRDEANAQFRLDRFVHNGSQGETYALEARGRSKLLLEQSHLVRNVGGLLVCDAAKARITDCLLLLHGRPRDLDAIEVRGEGHAIVTHNVLAKNAGAAVRFHSGGSGEVRHNIVVRNRQGLVAPERRGLLMSCGYNDVFNNGVNYVGLTAPPTDVSCDPSFVGDDEDDYRLQPGSTCLTAGRAGRALGPRTQQVLQRAEGPPGTTQA
jgi:parallel beta-helix repeat protein